MLKINGKKIIPLLLVVLGLLFAYVGIGQLGFWKDAPGPGFFPSIMGIVLAIIGTMTFIVSIKDKTKATYHKDEIMVILGGIGIFVGTFIIGLVPTIIVYLLLWLKIFEKLPWKTTFVIMGISLFITIGVFGTWLGIHFPLGLIENLM